MIFKVLSKLHQQLSWEFLISILFIWGTLLFVLIGDFSFELQGSNTYFFAEATRFGVDVDKRVSFFYQSVGVAFLSFPLIYFGLLFIKSKINYSAFWKDGLLLISTFGCINLVSQMIGVDTESIRALLLCAASTTFLFSWLSTKNSFLFLASSTRIFLLFGSSFLLSTLVLVVFNSDPWIVKNGVTVIACMFLLMSTVNFIFIKFKKDEALIFEIVFFLIPFPYLLLISSEFVFWLKFKLDYRLTLGILMPIVITCFGVLRYFILRKGKVLDETKLIKRISLSLFFTVTLCVFFKPFLAGTGSLFEIANITNSQMRFWKFDELPFLNFLSSHVLSEQWPGYLYHSIFGYKPNMDFLVYHAFHLVFCGFFGFLIFRKLFQSQILAFVVILFFPLLYDAIGFGFLPCLWLFIVSIRQEMNVKWYVMYLVVSIVLVLLRLDLGISCLYVSVLWLPILIYTKQIKINTVHALKGIGLTLAVCVLLFGISCLLVTFSTIQENFKSALHYITSNQAHGYQSLTYVEDHRFLLYYLGIPIVAIVIIICSVLALRKATLTSLVKLHFQIASFTSLYTLGNFQRALVRHGFVENWDAMVYSTFVFSLACFITAMILHRNQLGMVQRFSVFCFSLFIAFLAIKNFDLTKSNSFGEKFLEANAYHQFDSKFKKVKKDRMLATGSYSLNNNKKLKAFFNQFENKEETFIDFTNVPNLYYELQRKVPSYFNQSLQNMVGDELQISHIHRWKREKPKFVIFSSLPSYTQSFADQVSYNLRYYLASTYIYSNYTPHRNLDGFSIWVLNRDTVSYDLPPMDSTFTFPQQFDYGEMGSYFGDFLTKSKPKITKKIIENIFFTSIDSIQYPLVFSNTLKNKSQYLLLKLAHTTAEKSYTLEILNNGVVISTYVGKFKKYKKNYAFVLSNTYGWFQPGIKTFRWKDGLGQQKIEMKQLHDNRL
jgi:hypothetical protein